MESVFANLSLRLLQYDAPSLVAPLRSIAKFRVKQSHEEQSHALA
jgi:hypothetical protein